MELLQAELKNIRMPTNADHVYKDECVYSYDTPESDTGLYVSLTTFLGFGEEFIEPYYKKTNNKVYLHIKRNKTEIPVEPSSTNEGGPEKKITRLAIGVEGGFDSDMAKPKYEYKDTYKIVVFPSRTEYPYPDGDNLPMFIENVIQTIISSESALSKLEKAAMSGTWDGEKRKVSDLATNLLQLSDCKKIPPTGWQCEKCDLQTNLWLNLTDGSILCGRRFFDGSGGNDHAVIHYQATGYPLAVKLGTITADGKGDVFSYSEDDMVEDPYLVEHLAHFGIKTTQMQKTEKSMIELELDINQRIGEWSILTESASKLIPIAGPGYTGMHNLGNSCYLNSVMQVIFVIPDFIERFVNGANNYFMQFPLDPTNNFNIQMSKLGVGLLSGKYSKISENTLDTVDSGGGGISPAMFKNFIGRNHVEFSSKLQQDAQDYFLHLLNILEQNSSGNEMNPSDALKFTIEDRVQCTVSKKVKYTQRDEYCLPLAIPLHKATNIDEVRAFELRMAEAASRNQKLKSEDLVRPIIPLQACLDSFGDVEHVEQFYSTAIGDRTDALKTARMATMPDYLILHLRKFTLNDNWQSIKLDVAVDVPDLLDLGSLRATGKLPEEELLPENPPGDLAPPPPEYDANVIAQLMEMGFPLEGCKRAIFFSKNAGLGAATQWIMEHLSDPDFYNPFVPPGTESSAKNSQIHNPQDLEQLMSMGFSQRAATKALKKSKYVLQDAIDYIFANVDRLEIVSDDEDGGDGGDGGNANANASGAGGGAGAEQMTVDEQAPKRRDGDSKYKLIAFISHMGTSSQVGHYVCHILKNDQWVIFNDNKVAISQNPPKDLGYLYLYQRI